MQKIDHNLNERIQNGIVHARYGDFLKYVIKEGSITRANYYRTVKGLVKNPQIGLLKAIARWFGCTLEELLDPTFKLIDSGEFNKKSAQVSSNKDELARLLGLNKEAA